MSLTLSASVLCLRREFLFLTCVVLVLLLFVRSKIDQPMKRCKQLGAALRLGKRPWQTPQVDQAASKNGPASKQHAAYVLG